MGLLTFNQALTTANIDGPISSEPSTMRPILPVGNQVILPNHFFRIGSILRLTATGYISIVTATQVTIILDFNMGAAGITVVISLPGWKSVANGIFKDRVPFRLEGIFTIRAVGKTTATNGYGIFKLHCEALVGSPLSTVGGSSCILSPPTAPVSSSGFDNTIANMVYLESRLAATSQVMQVNQYVLESLN